MVRALKWKLKDARREICRWQDILQHVESIFEKEPGYKPTPANPLVFHLHGALDISESLVLTEDDYLTFLANMAAKPDLLPEVVQQAFAATSFLFIGYRLGDWNFRVLFQTLRARQQFSSIVVLKPPDETDPNRAAHQAYFEKFYGALDMKVFWGTAREFSSQLDERWATFERNEKMSAEPVAAESKDVLPSKSGRELDDKTWERLLKRIRDDKCTPVIGSGACTAPPVGADPAEWAKLKYPSKEQIALKFAADYAYPLDDQTKLERVAKYVAATDDIMAPKEAFAEHYGSLPSPNFSAWPNEPHRVLADLPFPVYLTSNFDDWMFRALTEYKKRDARLAICRWNRHIPEKAPSFDREFAYSVANPLVYHFHGCTPWAESAVVTEDDYFEFLINISRDYKSLAHRVDRALGGALLFLGYTLSDWDFLVLFRLFANKLRDSGNTHIAVQLEPSDTPGEQAEKAAKAVKYLDSYFGSAQVKIYWGTCQQFCEELRVRWEAFSRG